MSVLTNYYGNAVLAQHFGAGPTGSIRYVGLMTADPTVTFNASVEVTGGSYVRQGCLWTTASNRTTANAAALNFDNMPAVTVTYIGVFDAATGGNLWMYRALSVPMIVAASSRITIAVNDIAITLG